MKTTAFAIIGGDKRNVYVKEYLEKAGHSVSVFGLDQLAKSTFPTLEETVSGISYIIGPTLFSRDSYIIDAPFAAEPIPCQDFLSILTKGQTLFTGNMLPTQALVLQNKKVQYVDILSKKELAVINAVPTAEGAMELAISHTDFTLHQSNTLVMGYGNIGKVLARLLQSFGAHVYVLARKPKDLAAIRAFGFYPVSLPEFESILPQMDIVFNTIPFVLIDDKNIQKFPEQAVYIELASKPYGIAPNVSTLIHTVMAQGLPGKTAPKTAAKYIKEFIETTIRHLEE